MAGCGMPPRAWALGFLALARTLTPEPSPASSTQRPSVTPTLPPPSATPSARPKFTTVPPPWPLRIHRAADENLRKVYLSQFNPYVVCFTSLSYHQPWFPQPEPHWYNSAPFGWFECVDWLSPTPTTGTKSSTQTEAPWQAHTSSTPPWNLTVFFPSGREPLTVYLPVYDPYYVCSTSLSWLNSPVSTEADFLRVDYRI
jgi:hypothetical protein